ncbi:MAG: AAA family ATPase [Spirulinaceae cyanobacterium RM2_2_10]|nr:AAA family ATPase [Spirulinaceae cyanobacterium RM2_2_10]
MKWTSSLAAQNSASLATLRRTLCLGQGNFALVLLHCNYTSLQGQIWQALQAEAELPPLRAVSVGPKAQSLLELLLAVPERQEAALVVFDLDSVRALDNLLRATNQVRDEFRKQFQVPILLWVTDDVLQALSRCAPDFKSWAAAPIRFDLAVTEAIDLWWQTTDRLFEDLLLAGCDHFLSNDELGLAPGERRRRELELARADLNDDDVRLLPLSEATWQFILGRDAFAAQQFERAIAHYQASLEFWSNGDGYWELCLVELANRTSSELAPRFTNPFLQQKALLLVHLGFAYSRQARARADDRGTWLAAQDCWGASLEIFTVKQHAENAAQAIGLLCEALAALAAWDALDELACYALEQPAIGTTRDRLARIYAAFARVSLVREDAAAAEYWAQLALDVGPLGEVSAATYASHLLQLAQAKQQLGETTTAMQALEQARSLLSAAQPPATVLTLAEQDKQRLYCQVLAQLRDRYREQRQYLLAFRLKQEQQWVEQKCGLRAFQGLSPLPRSETGTAEQAALLTVSGRQPEVEQLLERLMRSDRKLLILHGAPGTGKSTLLRAGLLPALQSHILAAREVLTVFQSHYLDWETELCRVFADALRQYRRHPQALASPAIPPWLPDRVGAGSVLERLRPAAGERYFTVLIFDQLEDFFRHHPQPATRQQFGRFLYEAMRLPFVKVVLCLREDYLYELLALEAANPNLLDDNWLARENRYPLGDLSREAAIAAIQYLTKQAQRPLEPELIEAVAAELAGTDHCVRPLELQLIGAQLQSDHITTWTQYQQLGPRPKAVLLARSLEASVADCGPEYEAIAWQVLLALTDASGGRPRRPRQILQQLVGLRRSPLAVKPNSALHSPTSSSALALVLEILCGSGLVRHIARDDSYQLTRDYLVELIRQHVRQRTEQAYTRRLQASQLELARARRERWRAALIGGLMAALAAAAGLSAVQAQRQRQLAQQAAADAQIAALSASSEALFQAGKQFDALIEALRATTRLVAIADPTATPTTFPQATQPAISSATQLRALASLEQALATIQERNRLQGHADIVWHLDFSPDGRRLATAGRDGQVKILAAPTVGN